MDEDVEELKLVKLYTKNRYTAKSYKLSLRKNIFLAKVFSFP